MKMRPPDLPFSLLQHPVLPQPVNCKCEQKSPVWKEAVLRVWMCIKAWSPKYNSQELISTAWLPSEMVARLHFPENHRGIGDY